MPAEPGLPLAKEQLTVSNAAVGFASIPSGTPTPDWAYVSLETDNIRFWVDGSTPTSSVGHLMTPGDVLILRGKNEISKFKAIRTNADATLFITYGAGTY